MAERIGQGTALLVTSVQAGPADQAGLSVLRAGEVKEVRVTVGTRNGEEEK